MDAKPMHSFAIDYAMKKKAKNMARGGMAEQPEEKKMCHLCHGSGYAEGGFVHEEEESGYDAMPKEHEGHMYEHADENQDDHEDMVGSIMKKRMPHYSEGGKVANDTPIKADFEDNQYDDLVKDDGLAEHYTGANSGDELGDGQEDEDRHDMISMIMKSRKKKDHLPHPM